MPRKLIKMPVVLDRVAESKSEIYRKMNRGDFPLPVRQGPNSVAWYEDEIEKYINTRPRRAAPDVERFAFYARAHAWDKISDDARREFVATLKEGGWL